jgi:adenylosuccinate synthase
LDCVYPACKGAKTYEELPTDARQFVEKVEQQTNVPVVLIGTGPDALDIIDRRK